MEKKEKRFPVLWSIVSWLETLGVVLMIIIVIVSVVLGTWMIMRSYDSGGKLFGFLVIFIGVVSGALSWFLFKLASELIGVFLHIENNTFVTVECIKNLSAQLKKES